jgi:acetyl esterase/lipase
MRALWVAGLAAAIGCGQTGAAKPAASAPKAASTTAARPAAPAPAPTPAAQTPAAPAAAAEREALWALAPDGATFGLVVSPRGVAMIERAAAAVQDLLGSSPDFAAMNTELMHLMLASLGSMTPTLAGFGMSHDRGFAMFVVGDDQPVLVLPVVDRTRFLAAVDGRNAGDSDLFGTWVCKPIDGRYVCAQRRALLTRLGGRGLDALRRTIASRGDLELASRHGIEPLARTLVAAAELDRGTVIVRGTWGGVTRAVVETLGAPARPRAESATAAGFGMVDLAPVLSRLPGSFVMRGITLADLGRTVVGPISYVVDAGTGDPGIRIPLRDPAPFGTLVAHCSESAWLAGLGAAVRDGACRLRVSADAEVDGWIDGQALRIGNREPAAPRPIDPTGEDPRPAGGAVGGPTPRAPASPIAPSRLASELAQGTWSAVVSGRGSYLVRDRKRWQLPWLPVHIEGLARVAPLLGELGAGLRRDGDAVHFVLGLRTVWDNPDDVVRKLLAISSDDLESGKSIEIARSIAAAAPRSAFAQDRLAGATGLVGVAAVSEAVRDFVLPAWITSVTRAKYLRNEVHLGADDAPIRPRFRLAESRAAFKTKIVMKPDRTPAPDPPRDVLIKTHYRRGTAELVAYETPPQPGARRPAIVWITGGFRWGIDAGLWKPAPRSNDQTAAALRRAGLVVMYPALRGFSGNPGKPECFLGEVDDILAAADHLAKRPDVDPARIYLGGHSTGGTLALLAAESTDRFRAVFAFGPVADPRVYGQDGCLPEDKLPDEYALRMPAFWIREIVTPTLVIEGEHSDNVDAFPVLQRHASPAVTFAAIAGADHFTVLAPATEAIGRAILADTTPQVSMTLDTAAIARSVAHD